MANTQKLLTGRSSQFADSGGTGAQGFQGFQGPQGNQGLQGFQGSAGPQGNQGFQGLQGNQGNQGSTGTGASMADTLLLKPFFTAQGLLPSTIIREDLYTWPAADFSNLNGGTAGVTSGRLRYTPSGNPANLGWDMGASYGKTLIAVGGLRPESFAAGIFLSRTVGGPVTNEPKDGFAALIDGGGTYLYKSTGGGAQILQVTETKLTSALAFSEANNAMAMTYDGTTVKIFVRYGAEIWIQAISQADASFADFRYAGMFFSAAGTGNIMWAVCPLGIYGQ